MSENEELSRVHDEHYVMKTKNTTLILWNNTSVIFDPDHRIDVAIYIHIQYKIAFCDYCNFLQLIRTILIEEG